MPDKESFGGELAKQIPVKEIYEDLAHPTLSTMGKTLQGVTKIALAPISALIWGYDKIANYLEVAIPEYFEKHKISEEHITTPDPAIAVPIIDAMRYTSHKKEPREMFTNLLGSAMNSNTTDEHPAFVEIIKQLSTDECRIMKYLYNDNKMPMLMKRLKVDGGGGVDLTPYFSDICFKANCLYPMKFPEYLDNLHRLGLVEVFYDRHLTNDMYYDELRKHPNYPSTDSIPADKIEEKKSIYVLSEFGKRFCRVCIG